MESREFVVDIDGRRVVVNQDDQQVAILDGAGNVVFRDRIQVAAVSKSLFSALDHFDPSKTA